MQAPVADLASLHSYSCNSGETIAATYPSADSATIRYKGSTYNMLIAISASGARYVDGDLEWWTRGSGAGSEGTLSRQGANGAPDQSIESCIES
ncbi:MliC family protein [Dokdonella sp.]|uniref:MliC family protein n=1 Tax=Dokdonella sp. TaxID=2291710 RepID=UPI003C6FF2B7